MKNFIKQAEKFLTPNYRRQPVALVRGKGLKVRDNNGRSYLDFTAGIAVVNLGHAHPRIAAALCRQAKTLLHTSNLYHILPQIELAELLVKNSNLDRVFFCNSGTEAVEAALKLARKYAREVSGRGYEIIAAKNSFHGRTFGALSATGQPKFHKGFEPMLPGFSFVEFGNISALKKAVSRKTCAVILEVVQAEGGVNIAPAGYFQAVRKLCDQNHMLLILDEVQTGMGRLGKLFGYQFARVRPDIITLAKALGNGFPIGAMLAREKAAEVLNPGSHASTFGGNFLASVAALETVKLMLREKWPERAGNIGKYFLARLKQLKQKHPAIKEVRGAGLMLGAELAIDRCERVIDELRQKGFLVNLTQGRILRFIPPLIVSTKEIDMLISCLDNIMTRYDAEMNKQ